MLLLGRLGKNLYSQLKVAKKNFDVCLWLAIMVFVST